VFPVILVRTGRFVGYWPKEDYTVWILSYMTLLRTEGEVFRESVSALFNFIRLSQFLHEFFSVLQSRSQVYISPGCANLCALLVVIMDPYGETQERSLP